MAGAGAAARRVGGQAKGWILGHVCGAGRRLHRTRHQGLCSRHSITIDYFPTAQVEFFMRKSS